MEISFFNTNTYSFFFFFFFAAVQNERQPRNTAQIRLDSVPSVTAADPHELTTSPHSREAASSTVSTHRDLSPTINHRFMASLMTAETCAKLEPEDGKSLRDSAV